MIKHEPHESGVFCFIWYLFMSELTREHIKNQRGDGTSY